MNYQAKASDERAKDSPAVVSHLLIVTGRPASGKTTLANWLARELRIPVVSKDGIREVLFERLGWKDRPWARLMLAKRLLGKPPSRA